MFPLFMAACAGVLAFIYALVWAALRAAVTGTLVYFLWPVGMVKAFGAPALDWYQSVALVWLVHLLIHPVALSKRSSQGK